MCQCVNLFIFWILFGLSVPPNGFLKYESHHLPQNFINTPKSPLLPGRDF